MNSAFPGGAFPVGAIHELISPTEACAAAANGFLAGLLSTLMKKGGVCLWISARRKLFAPALKFFGVEPHRVIFIDVKREKVSAPSPDNSAWTTPEEMSAAILFLLSDEGATINGAKLPMFGSYS